jgi:hypothetical protein
MSVLHQIGLQWQTNNHTIQDPGTGGTFKQDNVAFGMATVGAGTYKLPDSGLPMYVRATGAVVVKSIADVTVVSLVSGQIALCVPLTSTTWASTTLFTAGAESLPNAKFTTSAAASGVVPTGAAWSGARLVIWQNTTDGAMAVTTPAGADLEAALTAAGLPSTYVYMLRIANRGDNTITITGGDNVTIIGEATIATLVTRDYLVSVAPAGTSMRSVSKGTIET